MPEQLAPNLRIDETQTPTNDPLFTPSGWLAAMRDVYGRLSQNPVGRLVVDALSRDTVIVPWPDVAINNAVADAQGGLAGHRHGTLRGEQPRSCWDGSPITSLGPGTGTGVGGIVRYTPWMWWGPFPWLPLPQRENAAYVPYADELLTHELLHAVQRTLGVNSCTVARHGYDVFAEFCAIMVENMYMGCAPDRPIRNNHRGWRMRSGSDPNDVLPPTLREVDEAIMLDRFRRLMRDFTNDLEALDNPPARYNPFRLQRLEERRALGERVQSRPAAR